MYAEVESLARNEAYTVHTGTCWYCEAIRESHTSAISRVFKSSKDPVELDLERLHSSPNKIYDPEKMPHISAHGVIRFEKASSAATTAVKAAELERNYQKACKRARKQGREPPTRDMSYNYWGYPMDMPYYAPYMGYYPYAYGIYPTSIACGSFTAGAAGNCCQGYADHQ